MSINNKYQELDWTKNSGLIPAIIQHSISGTVLMLGYMNKKSLIATEQTGYVTFFSRSKNRLWVKGEKSGNVLKFINWCADCDLDTLLILAIPKNELTCHKNTHSCFQSISTDFNFLYQLEHFLSSKKKHIFNSNSNNQNKSITSYTTSLYNSGIERIAQKVGEEGLETALAAISNNPNTLINEAADLIYHLLVLLQYKSLTFNEVIHELKIRNNFVKKSI